ncbi:PspC domain-containing protein [Sphingomonas sp. Mn802worker]|uniref:PspC domain-containing protein n=1 Tax=Sphingomonas sp. Mn802worker TaxID=629773 RepID=UPI00037D2912|nr:PspC domain-containing protein [Sphingomonas sp. Mn802worker]
MTEQQQISKPARNSIFGVCAAIAGDFGIDPLWLRLSIGAALMWNLEVALIAYATLAAIVLLSRLASPDRSARTEPTARSVPIPVADQGTDAVNYARAA